MVGPLKNLHQRLTSFLSEGQIQDFTDKAILKTQSSLDWKTSLAVHFWVELPNLIFWKCQRQKYHYHTSLSLCWSLLQVFVTHLHLTQRWLRDPCNMQNHEFLTGTHHHVSFWWCQGKIKPLNRKGYFIIQNNACFKMSLCFLILQLFEV